MEGTGDGGRLKTEIDPTPTRKENLRERPN